MLKFIALLFLSVATASFGNIKKVKHSETITTDKWQVKDLVFRAKPIVENPFIVS